MKKALLIIAAFAFTACSSPSGDQISSGSDNAPQSMVDKDEAKVDDGKGVGVTSVTLNDPLDQTMIDEGQAIYDMKCAACHKLTDQRVVGPGWAGLTDKRKPEWIINMITNVDVMLEEDATAQALLEECLTRMPNQNVTVAEARSILEFMYFNDSKEG